MSRNSKIADRGRELALFYPTISVVNARGETILLPGLVPFERWINAADDRSADAELVGQVSNKILRVTTRSLPDVDSWSRIEFRGEVWDLAVPASRPQGLSRTTTHVELIIRSRNQSVAE